MVKTKSNSVNIKDIHPLLKQFLEDMSSMFIGIVVTSGNDSVHMVGSRHYIGKALDFGANSSEKKAYAAFKSYVLSNKKSLKEKYQLEDIIDEGTHIHVEMPLTIDESKTIKTKQYTLIGIGVLVLSGILLYYFKIKK